MLCRWILVHRRLSRRHGWLGFTNYSTQRTEIETVVRSELRGFTNEAATKLVDKNRFLLQIQPNEMKKSFKTLRKLNFQTSDIKTHPRLLLQSEFQLINNFQRLQEVGFLEVTAYRLANVKKIMSKSMHFNQCFNFLPSNLNVLQSVFAVAKVPIEPFDENAYDREMKLEAIHRIALRQYMLKQIEYTSLDIDEIWHYFPALKMRSLQSIDKSARLLETAYNTRVKHLPKFILNMQPEEIEELLDTATICGTDVKKIMTLAPKCNLTRIKEIQTICWSYKIPDYALAYSPKLFYVNFNTLRERLNLISKLKQANEFFQHVAIGKVILCIDRVKAYVESKKMDFDAIFDDTFVDFILNGFVFVRSTPSLFYLCDVFKKTEDEVKNALQIHPHSKRYSFPVIYQNIEYLLSQGFTHEDIFNDLHIILYSVDEIKEFFNRLKDPSEMEKLNVDPNRMSKSQTLRLCIYFIEKKCDFNGEGVFLSSHTVEFNDEDSWHMEEIIKQSKI